ncbi:RidA family protein [Photobacterium atrarenae]|uniref:RidA family protein n=1 Tax=Photobacterium atrarenae TaxID=865757 RepID=A0ABY5GN29_9GAMM|nr:RidA family protein [Photobacterium atrarenae]UTV30727.1 RidA family protein [Photobacterium atrarenae]
MTHIIRKHINDRMSKIVTHNNTVYLCGQVGNRGDTIEAQTREALTRVDRLLEEAGSDRKHILQAIVWLSDMDDFSAMNDVWDNWFEPGSAPARACGEAKLASPELKFEVIVTAALKSE